MNNGLYNKLKEQMIAYDETYKKLAVSIKNERSESDHTTTEFLWGDEHSIKMEILSLLQSAGKSFPDYLLKLLEELCPNAYEQVKDLSGKRLIDAINKINTKTTDNFYFMKLK